jgi:hypothetical protein
MNQPNAPKPFEPGPIGSMHDSLLPHQKVHRSAAESGIPTEVHHP